MRLTEAQLAEIEGDCSANVVYVEQDFSCGSPREAEYYAKQAQQIRDAFEYVRGLRQLIYYALPPNSYEPAMTQLQQEADAIGAETEAGK